VTSPLWARFDQAIAAETNAIIAAQVSPWAHMQGRDGMSVQRFDGSTIAYSKVRYTESIQQVFWTRYIEPFLERMVLEHFRAIPVAAKEGGADPAEVVPEVEGMLVAACRKVYARMVDVDQRLRGDGFPDGITPRGTQREFRAMEEFIRRQAQAAQQMAAIASRNQPVDSGVSRYRWVALVVAPVAVLALIAVLWAMN
jgi:hypothetical protein